MDSNIITDTNPHAQYNGRKYLREDADKIKKRKDLFELYCKNGLTQRHAWFKSFEQYPREYLDEEVGSDVSTQTNGSDSN